MGANGIKLARWAVLAVVVAASVALLAACGSSSSTTSTLAAVKNSAPAQPATGSHPGPLREDEIDTIANFLFGLAKDPAKNFIMDKIGIPTTESQLKELSAKLDALSAQLHATEVRLSAQIAELSLQGRIDYLKDQAANLDSMYSDYMLPLVASLIKVKEAEAKVPHDQAAIDAATADYNTHKSEFLNYANSITVTTLAKKFHNRLQPSDGDGVLRQYGTLIMTKRRILNQSDSQRLGQMYLFLEEYQALATWMTVERAIAVGGTSKDTIKPTLDAFFAWQKEQRDPNKPNGLLPVIPTGVAIDRGQDGPAQSYSTAGKPMFTYVSGMYAYAPSALFKSPVPPTVQAAIQGANNSKLRGFTAWTVPSQDEVYGLFAGIEGADAAKVAARINSIFGNIAIPRPWIWTSNTTGQHYCYEKPNKKIHCEYKDARRGVSTDDLGNDPHPRYNGFVNLDQQYRGAQGGLIIVRKTGDLEDYL